MHLVARFLRTYALPHWRYYLAGVSALYATNYLTVRVPRLAREAVDALSGHDWDTVSTRLGLMILFAVVIAGVRTASRVFIFNPGRAVEYRLKNHLFRHLLHLPRPFHDAHRGGDLVSRATNDLQSVRALIGFAGLQVLDALFIVPMTLYQMFSLDAGLSTRTLAVLLMAVITLALTSRMVVELVRDNMERVAALSDHVVSTYSAIPVVQGYCAHEAFDRRFDTLNEGYIRNGLRIAAIRAFLVPVVNLVGGAALGVVLWYGGGLVLEGGLTVGALVAYSAYIGLLVHKFTAYGWTVTVIQRGVVALRRIYAILDQAPESVMEGKALPGEVSAADGRVRGYRMDVRGLSFSYPASRGRDRALKGVDFTVEPGQTLGIFGPTGAGKSTLIHLLARVYEPPRGTVFLNGVDILDLSPTDLREIVAVVPQDPFLFSRTIRENILWGARVDPEAHEEDPRESLLARVVEQACLDQDLEALVHGLDTLVGARGVTLSGGQRQRVALARALARPFRVLLLDDVLSAVDHRTEQTIIRHLYGLTPPPAGMEEKDPTPPPGADHGRPSSDALPHDRARTTVIVSHRTSALVHADQILVLEAGRVVDRGSHDDLVRRDNLYAATFLAQQAEHPGPALDRTSRARQTPITHAPGDGQAGEEGNHG